MKPGKGFLGEEGWGDPTSFVLLRIIPGQSGEWAGRDWLENREADGALSWGTAGLGQRTRAGPSGQDRPQVSLEEPAR